MAKAASREPLQATSKVSVDNQMAKSPLEGSIPGGAEPSFLKHKVCIMIVRSGAFSYTWL